MTQDNRTSAQSNSVEVSETVGNILIVDESVASIQKLSQVLHDAFDINFATDAKTAVQLIDKVEPDLLLLNMDSDSIDYLTICRQTELPTMLYAHQLDEIKLVKGYQSGAVEIISDLRQSAELIVRINAQIAIDQLRRSPLQNITDANVADAGLRPQSNEAEQGKVLIVDDSVANIQVLNEILCDDYEVFFATSGKQAISMALEEHPDLIILDVVMPQMDGYTVCEHLKAMQETKDVGIIFVTSLNDVEDEAKGLKMGAIDYITKPYNAHIVRARMHNHMELVQHRKLLSSLSVTDGLTCIANRRQFDQVMHRELHRAIRQQESLTLMLVDIDNFKKYNDYYGHVNGDECLKEVASALDDSRVRMTDFVARYGGEEFAIILPNTAFDGAKFMAEKILKTIQDLAIEHINNNDVGVVTASVGVYSSVPQFNASKERLITLADEALYEAKSQGRNRVVFAQE